jgi:hypothetical protein
MEHMHLVVNLANDSKNNQPSAVPNTSILLKINKALLISKRDKLFFNEEYYKYAIELKVNGQYWVVFRRYSEIRDEHERLRTKFPALNREAFPPRSPFNKTDTFQMERQQKLETYLKNFIMIVFGEDIYKYSSNLRAPGSPTTSTVLTKEIFCDRLTFFHETTEDELNVQKLGWKSGNEFS